MIHVKEATILDILPHTFKTDEHAALSKAIAEMTALLYETMRGVLFWADIENASPALLDAMAAELDAPFYSTDLTDENKKTVIAAAFQYNAKVGTRSSVEALLTAAFGGGELSEWFEYGGKPYYFKVTIPRRTGIMLEHDNFDYFMANIGKFKNKRSKLEGIEITTENTGTIYLGATTVIEMEMEIPSVKYTTYEDIKKLTYKELATKTYREILHGEE